LGYITAWLVPLSIKEPTHAKENTLKPDSLIKLLVVSLLTVSLVACGGGGGGGSSSDSSTSGGGGSSSSAGFDASLIGTWRSVCMFIGGSEPYIIAIIHYLGAGQATDSVEWYSDAGCTSATGLKKVNISTYDVGESITASGKSGYEIDATINSWELTQDGVTVSSGTSVPTQYDIVAIDGDRLYNSGLTRSLAGPVTNPDDRPATLDLTNYYTRQ